MMTRQQESDVRAIFRKHIEAATDEICSDDGLISDLWWPEGYAERMAEILIQSLSLMQESCIIATGE